MSDTEFLNGSIEGWSFVRHKDDVGSDGDSVEIISDESDKDTSDSGKDINDELVTEAADSTTKESDDYDAIRSEETESENDLVVLDSLGGIQNRISKFHKLVHNHNDRSRNYVIASSALLALICSLTFSSYLLFQKFQPLPEKMIHQPASTLVLQELEQAVSRLQAALSLEQQIKDRHFKKPMELINAGNVEKDSTVIDKFPYIVQDEMPPWKEVDGKRDELHVGADMENLNSLSDMKPTHNSRGSTQSNTETPTSEANSNFGVKEVPTDDHKFRIQSDTLSSKNTEILKSLRQDILSVQNQLYSQVMSILFEQKIDLYRRLMNVGLFLTRSPDDVNKVNQGDFTLIKNLEEMIGASTQSNFESWFTFYSASLSPKFVVMVNKIDSVVYGRENKTVDDETVDRSSISDDFFVRSPVPNYETANELRRGFDWKNLDKKIKETLDKSRLGRGGADKIRVGPIKLQEDGESIHHDRRKYVNRDENVGEASSKVTSESSENVEQEDEDKIESTKDSKKHDKGIHDKNRSGGKFGKGQMRFEEERKRGAEDNKKNSQSTNKGNARYHFHGERSKRKSFLNNMTKYVKKAASGLWKTVRGGFKKVKNYGSYLKDWHTSDGYEQWRNEFVKEMKDVVKVLAGNPAINGLSELPKSVTRLFGDGLSNLMKDEMEDGSFDEGYKTCSSTKSKVEDGDGDTQDWYGEASKHRAESRGHSYPRVHPRPSDSWFLRHGRHRSYLRRRGIHLHDDGSWFIASARHRTKMRQQTADSHQFVQASSKSFECPSDTVRLFGPESNHQ